MTSLDRDFDAKVTICKRVADLESELLASNDEARIAEIIPELRRLAPRNMESSRRLAMFRAFSGN